MARSMTRRVPPVIGLGNRKVSASYDGLNKNCYIEQITDPNQPKAIKLMACKRAGLKSTYTQTANTGQGQYTWNGFLYQVLNGVLYKTNVSLGTLTGGSTTARCYFDEIQGGTPRLIIKLANKIFSVTTTDTIADVSSGMPLSGNLVAGIVNLDGYIFVASDVLTSTSGTVAQTGTANDPTSWGASYVLTPSLYADGNTGIARHLNYVLVTGQYSTEFFYDAGNATGSVLSPVEGTAVNFGCPNGATIATASNSQLFMVAQGKNKLKYVVMFKGLDYNPSMSGHQSISTPQVERYLQAETDFSSAFAYYLHSEGHHFYVINLPNTNVTLSFDIDNSDWSIWSFYDGANENYLSMTGAQTLSGEVYMQHISNGKTYKLDTTTYQDDSQQIKWKFVTNNLDFGTMMPKVYDRVGIVCDKTATTSNVQVRYSDDDYNTWSTSRNVDISTFAPVSSRWGTSSKRAWELQYTDNFPFRLEAIEFDLKINDYSKGSV